MGTTPWSGKDHVKEGEDYAASHISHDDAVECMKKLTGQGTLPKGWKFSLPTEAQWEYAIRAGTTTRFSFGDDDFWLIVHGWYAENADKKTEEYAHQAGVKKPNAWGLKDMHGNLREWCSDWYGRPLQGGKDPVGPSSAPFRVHRGGCWASHADACRSAYRFRGAPGVQNDDVGFRIATVHE
jgi:formylglycine-generating enzyme required for sulfatase activity